MVMNHLKEYVKKEGHTHFLTYADNFAVGYFKKQGFTKNLTMDRDRWYVSRGNAASAACPLPLSLSQYEW